MCEWFVSFRSTLFMPNKFRIQIFSFFFFFYLSAAANFVSSSSALCFYHWILNYRFAFNWCTINRVFNEIAISLQMIWFLFEFNSFFLYQSVVHIHIYSVQTHERACDFTYAYTHTQNTNTCHIDSTKITNTQTTHTDVRCVCDVCMCMWWSERERARE